MAKPDIEIKVGSGPDELAQGKEKLNQTLHALWKTLQQDSSAEIPLITFKFGARESWLRLSMDLDGKPLVGYADKDHLAMLLPLKGINFLSEVITANHFYDIDKELREELSYIRGSNPAVDYPPISPRLRLENENPSIVLNQPHLASLELEAAEKGHRQFGMFNKPAANTPPITPEPGPKKGNTAP